MKPHIPFPKTRLEDYIEYSKELASETRLAAIRVESGKNPEKQYREYIKRSDKITLDYKDKLYTEDFHYFNKLPDLETFLRGELELREYKVKEIVRHEKKHANKAWDLGYVVNGFGCVILRMDKKRNKISYAAFTRVKYDRIVSLKDLGEIASSPSKLSFGDKLHPKEKH